MADDAVEDFNKAFEAWCAGDKSEPFHWERTWFPPASFRASARPRRTLWQRYWSSPWTWGFWTIVLGWNLTTHQSLGWAIVNWVSFIIVLINFTLRGDERWGKP